MGIKKYNKLVRDRIPEIIEAGGSTCVTEILSDEEYLKMIDAKLDEELAEYHQDQNLEELADLTEVIHAAVIARGYTLEDLERVRAEKAAKRGGFEKKILLKETRESVPDAALFNLIVENGEKILKTIDLDSVRTYMWIQDNYRKRDVSTDREFQTMYSHFYGMNRFTSLEYRQAYFQTLQKLKQYDFSFRELAEQLYAVDQKHELSFISKMMHTVDPTKPIYDSRVNQILGLNHRYYGSFSSRIQRDIETLEQIANSYRIFLKDSRILNILDQFEALLPGCAITQEKKIDFLLWTIKDKSNLRKE